MTQFKDDSGGARQVILLNTEHNSDAKKQLLEQFSFADCYYFFHAFAAADWYRGYQYNRKLIPINERKIQKKFITFNRLTGNARVYRSFLIAELANHQLLEHGYISYSHICPCHGSYQDNITQACKKFNVSADYAQKAIDILDQINYPLTIDTGPEIPNGSQSIGALDQCVQSFLHIVTETCFWDQKEHLTEKIFKPIVTKNPFVLLGCAGNLKYLKNYGFKTFDQWWDEGYDEIQDPIARLQAVVKIVKDICELSNDQLTSMMHEMHEVLEYNHNWFYSQEFLNLVWQELEINLGRAIESLPLLTSTKT